MKKFIRLLIIVLMSLISLNAQTIRLKWCPSPDSFVNGYKLVYTSQPKIVGWSPNIMDENASPCPGIILVSGTNWCKKYTMTNDVGNATTTVISNLIVGKTYYFAVISYTTNYDGTLLDSDPSNELEYTVPYITYLGARLEWWTNMMFINRQSFNLTSFTNPPPFQFYRSSLIITNRLGITNVVDLKCKLEWWTNLSKINNQIFNLTSFTNTPKPQFYRSFLVITNKPF